jgi:hypothetical protein
VTTHTLVIYLEALLDPGFTAEHARQLAAALFNAADKVDEITGEVHTRHDPGLAWVKTAPPGPWVARAACAGLATPAFVEPVGAAAVAWAEHVCEGWCVLDDCRAYAAEARAFGVWGGQLWRAGKVQQAG